MITPLPGATPTKPGSATLPFPGIVADVVDGEGKPVTDNSGGYLVIKHPWPSMMRTVYGDAERFRRTYWEHIRPETGEYIYFAGDGAHRDQDGYFWVMGRVDDVINVSGHRLGTMEIESALVSHPAVAEAAVVGKPDEIKGEEIVAFVTLEGSHQANEALEKALKQHVVQEIGAIAVPVRFDLPMTYLKPALAKSCGDSCGTWLPARKLLGILLPCKIVASWTNSGKVHNSQPLRLIGII